jgi:hypothetical protein
MLVPIVFVVVLVLQTGGPNDVPLGRYIRDTGLASRSSCSSSCRSGACR